MKLFARTSTRIVSISLLIALLCATPLVASALTLNSYYGLASLGSFDNGGDEDSVHPSISGDGTLVAFSSWATDLIDGETANGNSNIYLFDVRTRTTTLVTKGASGNGGNNNSDEVAISADGSVLVFRSVADDLIDDMTTLGDYNVFLYEIETAETKLITTGPTGEGSEGWVWGVSVSGDGSRIAFCKESTDLLEPEITLNGARNVFLYERSTDTTTLVTKGGAGNGGDSESTVPEISYDGSKIVFSSTANDLIDSFSVTGGKDIYIYDVATDTISLVSGGPSGHGTNSWRGNMTSSGISADNTKIVFLLNGSDVAGSANPDNSECIWLYDLASGTTTLLSAGAGGVSPDGDSYGPSISADGSTIGFMSRATNLIADTTTQNQNVFFYDTASGTLELVSKGVSGVGGNGYSYRPTLSSDGSSYTFHTSATDLIDGITTTEVKNVIVNANWSDDPVTYYTVTFDSQNGTDPVSTQVASGALVPAPVKNPTKAGFTFMGWWTEPNGGVLWDFANDVVEGPLTLYAHWLADKTVDPQPEVPPTGDALTVLPSILAIVTSMVSLRLSLRRKRSW